MKRPDANPGTSPPAAAKRHGWRGAILLPAMLAAACEKAAPDATTAPTSSAAASAPAATSTPAPPGTPPVDASALATPAAPETIIAQHILVAYRTAKRSPKGVTRSKAEAKARAAEALSKIQAGMTFEDAVKEYSDDAGSADRMGSVGKFHRGDMDPAFSAAAFALATGHVSDVVETPFGFHVIKRTQ